jgi:hypothetical protein
MRAGGLGGRAHFARQEAAVSQCGAGAWIPAPNL